MRHALELGRWDRVCIPSRWRRLPVGASLAHPPWERRSTPMSILMFILFGLIVGFIARAIMPGRQSMGFLATALIGVAGSFVGGVIGNLLSGMPILDLHASGFI